MLLDSSGLERHLPTGKGKNRGQRLIIGRQSRAGFGGQCYKLLKPWIRPVGLPVFVLRQHVVDRFQETPCIKGAQHKPGTIQKRGIVQGTTLCRSCDDNDLLLTGCRCQDAGLQRLYGRPVFKLHINDQQAGLADVKTANIAQTDGLKSMTWAELTQHK
jgi:hypothetical protein